MYHMRLKGNHYDMGLRFGSIAAKNGKRLLDNVPYPITDDRVEFAKACIPIYQRCFPEILEEIQGIADGQRCDFYALCAVLLSMYALPPSPACSVFAYSSDENIILGRNSDFLPYLKKLNSNFIYYFKEAHGYSFTGNTTAFVEMEDGVNSEGLAAGLTSVYPLKAQPGINGGMLVRYILERCSNTDEALDAIKGLPIASAQTIALADKGGNIAVIECDCLSSAVIRPEKKKHFVRAANMFTSRDRMLYDGIDNLLSERRYDTLTAALSSPDFRGSIENAKALLSGQYGFICQYDKNLGFDTVWSVIYDLTGGKIYRAEGNPGKTAFVPDTRFKR